MNLTLYRAKIHRATLTEANLNYAGSITIDEALLEASGIVPYEKVHVVNVTNGERLETYVIPGPRGSGSVCLNGAAARRGAPGDLVILIAYGFFTPEEAKDHRPTVVKVDDHNRIVDVKR